MDDNTPPEVKALIDDVFDMAKKDGLIELYQKHFNKNEAEDEFGHLFPKCTFMTDDFIFKRKIFHTLGIVATNQKLDNYTEANRHCINEDEIDFFMDAIIMRIKS